MDVSEALIPGPEGPGCLQARAVHELGLGFGADGGGSHPSRKERGMNGAPGTSELRRCGQEKLWVGRPPSAHQLIAYKVKHSC